MGRSPNRDAFGMHYLVQKIVFEIVHQLLLRKIKSSLIRNYGEVFHLGDVWAGARLRDDPSDPEKAVWFPT
jgi:hypothetical protein